MLEPLNSVDRLYVAWFVGLSIALGFERAQMSHWAEFMLLHAACVGAILVLAFGAGRNRVAHFLHDWYPLAMMIVTFEETARLSLVFVPEWQDGYLLQWEAAIFGTSPIDWLRRFANPVVTEVLEVGYFSYFALLMIAGGVLYRRRREFRQVMAASVITYLFCCAVYLAFPTHGPAHTPVGLASRNMAGGPFHWAVLVIQRYAGVHGNAFPSSHVAAGVVALFFMWMYRRDVAKWMTVLVLLLCLGAVYDGYHYAVDVIAGVVVGLVIATAVLVGGKRSRKLNPWT